MDFDPYPEWFDEFPNIPWPPTRLRQGFPLYDDTLQRVRSPNDPYPSLSIYLDEYTAEFGEAAGLAIKNNSHIEFLSIRSNSA